MAVLPYIVRYLACFVAIAALPLHIYTAVIAFTLAPSFGWGCVAAFVAWIAPGIAELVVLYHVGLTSGSLVTLYSTCLLVWTMMFVGVVLFERNHVANTAAPPSNLTTPPLHTQRRRNSFRLSLVFAALTLAVTVWTVKRPPSPATPPSPALSPVAFDEIRNAPVASANPTPAASPTSLRAASSTSPVEGPSFKKRAAAARAINARLTLAISPSGTVYINGRRKGSSPPLRELMLEPGKYAIEIRNDKFGTYRKSIEVRSGTKVKIAYTFNATYKEPQKEPEPKSPLAFPPAARMLSEQWPR
jgi:hypothetical protein